MPLYLLAGKFMITLLPALSPENHILHQRLTELTADKMLRRYPSRRDNHNP